MVRTSVANPDLTDLNDKKVWAIFAHNKIPTNDLIITSTITGNNKVIFFLINLFSLSSQEELKIWYPYLLKYGSEGKY